MWDFLFFNARYWPDVEIVRSERIVYAGFVDSPANKAFSFSVPPGKHAKSLSGFLCKSWWRRFVELDFRDPIQILNWCRRHGDPFAMPPDYVPVDTARWPALAALLKPAAELWLPRGEGVEAPSDDPAIRAAILKNLFVQPWIREAIDLQMKVDEPLGGIEVQPTVRTIAAFMAWSAIYDIHHRHSHKRCDWCSDWFHPARLDARFCTPSCRQAAHQAKGDK
jgi:hypothetical protein